MTQEYAYVQPGATSQEPLSVSAAMQIAKVALESITLSIVGEISDLSDNPRYKAVYFTLADEGAALPCLMWRSSFDRLGIKLKSGMQVEVKGRFSLYPAKGRMQFDVRTLTLAGEGQLRAQVAALAAKLQGQGLMDASRKLPVPATAETIALITSPRGKAVHDVLRTLARRFALARVQLYGVGVEGKGAAAGIVEALRAAAQSEAEVILLVRGGGSYEDLMPFNDEALARAIAEITEASKPIVTGIGHEPDTSLADMVASLRASTPTAAAEAVVPDTQEVVAQLDARKASLNASMSQQLQHARQLTEALQRSAVFTKGRYLISEQMLNLEQTALRLDTAIPTGLRTARETLATAEMRLLACGTTLAGEHRQHLQHLSQKLRHKGSVFTGGYTTVLSAAAASLESLSPLAVLARGYALGYTAEGELVRSVEEVSVGEALELRLADGRIKTRVEATQRSCDE